MQDVTKDLKRAIKSSKLSLSELSDRSGLSISTVQRILSPTWGRQVKTLQKIAGAVGKKITISE